MTKKVLVFGEVLVDKINGKFHPGGAPFNVACHLKGFGLEPDFISALSKDEIGEFLIRYIDSKDLSKEFLQYNSYPSGLVEVDLVDNEPSFTILENRSWDYLEYDSSLNLEDYELLYYGTLALRSEKNLQTLKKIKENFKNSIFVDLNIRDPFFNLDKVESFIRDIEFLKVNHHELKRLIPGNGTIQERIKKLTSEYRIKKVICTKGEDGVVYYNGSSFISCGITPVASFKDAVGAGDSFSGFFINSLIAFDREDIEGGTKFASRICGINGALPENRDFYRS